MMLFDPLSLIASTTLVSWSQSLPFCHSSLFFCSIDLQPLLRLLADEVGKPDVEAKEDEHRSDATEVSKRRSLQNLKADGFVSSNSWCPAWLIRRHQFFEDEACDESNGNGEGIRDGLSCVYSLPYPPAQSDNPSYDGKGRSDEGEEAYG